MDNYRDFMNEPSQQNFSTCSYLVRIVLEVVQPHVFKKETSKVRALRLEHFIGPSLIVLSGLLVATITLALELIYRYCIKAQIH